MADEITTWQVIQYGTAVMTTVLSGAAGIFGRRIAKVEAALDAVKVQLHLGDAATAAKAEAADQQIWEHIRHEADAARNFREQILREMVTKHDIDRLPNAIANALRPSPVPGGD